MNRLTPLEAPFIENGLTDDKTYFRFKINGKKESLILCEQQDSQLQLVFCHQNYEVFKETPIANDFYKQHFKTTGELEEYLFVNLL